MSDPNKLRIQRNYSTDVNFRVTISKNETNNYLFELKAFLVKKNYFGFSFC